MTINWTPAWDDLSGVKEYNVYRDSQYLGTSPSGTETYTDGTVAAGTTYAYLVETIDHAGNNNSGCDVDWATSKTA